MSQKRPTAPNSIVNFADNYSEANLPAALRAALRAGSIVNFAANHLEELSDSHFGSGCPHSQARSACDTAKYK